MMTKSDTIAAITKLNPTANPAFLAEFSAEDLVDYLQRLSCEPPPRNRSRAADLVPPAVAPSLIPPAIDCGS